jgi:pimeloyl-ACP methyl ester carboxylesterase/DNA-binding winged helix-turn-helix (wHTH) protein/class 3 adenylate cyclase
MAAFATAAHDFYRMVPASILTFGSFRLDPVSGQLCGPSGPVPLTPKAFAVLQHLAANAGRLVSKRQLLDEVWPGLYVGDGALKSCIREVRRALGDDAGSPRFIATAHRRGYRFVAPVACALASQAPAIDRRERVLPMTPRVRYARSGDVNIAYQVVGDGPLDLVFVMGWVSHLEYFWKEPSFARFLLRLASFSRLILLDKRGTGLSDRVPELPTLEQRMDDVRAVMDAVGSPRAALLGVSEGGPMCSLFAATYPERTEALVMIGSYAKRVREADYPWGTTREERDAFGDDIVRGWGGPVGLGERAPSKADDPAFRQWWASYLRMGASPGAALGLTRMNAEIDVRHVLPTVRVPTLVLHRTQDRCLRVEEGRYLAGLVPGARWVELPGEDHLPFVGDQESLLVPIERFLTGLDGRPQADRVLATILCASLDETSVGGPGRLAAIRAFQSAVAREVERFRGRSLQVTADRVSVLFDGPARAVRCARRLSEAAERLGLRLRAGLHTGECEPMLGEPRGLVVEMGAQLADEAEPGTVLVSRTVVDLVAGSGLRFVERGVRALAGAVTEWPVFVVAGDSADER